MRSIFSRQLHKRLQPINQRALHNSVPMSSASTSAGLYAFVTSPATAGDAPSEAKGLRHHLKSGKGFTNPWPSWKEMNGPAIGAAMAWRRLSGKANVPNTKPPTVPVHKSTFSSTRDNKTLRATWLGHACYYVEFPGGFRVLFDPVFTERCSPFSSIGPKRYTPLPCQIEDIPIIDAVVISHNHYDHLSHPTVMKIKQLHPNAHFFVPLRNKQWFIDSGITNVTDLDWWDSMNIRLSKRQETHNEAKIESVETGQESSQDQSDVNAIIGCLPCQHMGNRALSDRGHTLWGSWSVESGGKKIWFGGDTGYRAVPELDKDIDDYGPEYSSLPHCPAFEHIGKHRGPFDLGLIPIGAYAPRYIMSPMHAGPFDSVNIFVDTKCKVALGMHWGTWVLTEEDVMEPPKLLKEALRRKNIPEEGVFDICDIGESREFS